MAGILDRIRFPPEQELIDGLFDRFSLEALINHHVESGGVTPVYDFVLGSQLRLTPILAPRLCTILAEVLAALEFTAPVQLFVGQDAAVNAFAIHTLGEEMPHIVSLTSALVERMTDDELRFVLGHELGHLHFSHYRASLARGVFGEDEEGDPKVPPLLARRLESWERLAELSADRAGFLAVGGRLEPTVSAFFKMLSGLGPEHLRFDIAAFLEQLADLQRLERRELLSRFSHPVTPIRAWALQLYGEAGGIEAPAEQLQQTDAAIAEVARLMDYEATRPLDVNARDFLLAGGLLAACADGNDLGEDEWEMLLHLLLPCSSDPEAELARIESPEEARTILERSATWLRANAGEERFALLRQLAHVVAVDGKLHPGEQQFVLEVASTLDIPEKAANEILFDVLAGYHQTQVPNRAPRFTRPSRPPTREIERHKDRG